MAKYFPILIRLDNKKVLVVGGGNIALRKVEDLLKFGIIPDIISMGITSKLLKIIIHNDIICKLKEFEKSDVLNYDIVLAATNNPDIDKIIAEDCIKNNILLNVADVPELCSFILPSTIKKGNLTISVGSQGESPFFAKAVKENIESQIPEHLEDIAKLAAIFRKLFLENHDYRNSTQRNQLIKEFLKTDWNNLIENSGFDEALKKVNEILR